MMRKIRTVFKILLLILSLILLLVGIDWGMRYYQRNKSISTLSIEQQNEGTQYLYFSLRTIQELEEKGIGVEQEFKRNLRREAMYIFEEYQQDSLDVLTVAKFIYINRYFNLGFDKEFDNLLKQYYDKEKAIFSQWKYDRYNTEYKNSEEKIWINMTIEVANELYDCGNYIENYDIDRGLADWYNKYINQTDFEKEKEYFQTNLIGIFWYLYQRGKLDLIDYSKIQPIIQGDIEKECQYLKTNSNINNLTMVFYADEVHCYKKLFSNDNKYVELADKIFEKIDTMEKLEYLEDSAESNIFLFKALNIVKEPAKNDFFVKQVNSCLIENFNSCYQFEKEKEHG